jgi:hypothetical protein
MSAAPHSQCFHLLERKREGIEREPYGVGGDLKVQGMNRVVPLNFYVFE